MLFKTSYRGIFGQCAQSCPIIALSPTNRDWLLRYYLSYDDKLYCTALPRWWFELMSATAIFFEDVISRFSEMRYSVLCYSPLLTSFCIFSPLGLMADKFGSYNPSFYMAGTFTIVGSLVPFVIPRLSHRIHKHSIREHTPTKDDNLHNTELLHETSIWNHKITKICLALWLVICCY